MLAERSILIGGGYLSGGRRRDRDGGGILDRSYKGQHQDGPGAGVAHRLQLDAADSDIGAFRDDHWFVADVQRTGKYRHRQKRNKKKGKHSILHDVLLGETLAVPMLGRMRAWYSRFQVCIELTSAVLETPLERT